MSGGFRESALVRCVAQSLTHSEHNDPRSPSRIRRRRNSGLFSVTPESPATENHSARLPDPCWASSAALNARVRWLRINKIYYFSEVGGALSSMHQKTFWRDTVILLYTNEKTEAQSAWVTCLGSHRLTAAQLKPDLGLPVPSPVLYLLRNSPFPTSLE